MSQATDDNISKAHSRRAILAGIAASPALAAPALGLTDSSADAELLELGVQLRSIEDEYTAQQAIDDASPEFAVVRGADGQWETDEEPWDDIHDRLFPLCEEILSKRAHTIQGLAVQVRAVFLAARDTWEPVFISDTGQYERMFIEAVGAFAGIAPPVFSHIESAKSDHAG